MVVVQDVLEASNSLSLAELRRLHNDEKVKRKVAKSVLRDLVLTLVCTMVTESQESMDRMSELRTKPITTIKLPPLPMDTVVASDGVPLDASQPNDTQILPPLLQTSDLPHFPTSFTSPAKKRNISDTTDSTMPSNSTETTPKKMCHPETKVQSLQNKFMEALINTIWMGEVVIPWAQGRKMFLSYDESSPSISCLQ